MDRALDRGSRRRAEDGVALIWAIIIMMIITGLLVVIALSTMSTTREAKDAASRTRAVFWAEAAGKDLISRIENAEVGPWVQSIQPNGDFVVNFAGGAPSGLSTPSTRTFANGATSQALPLTVPNSTQRGWYQILSPATGLPAWSGVRVRSGADPGAQGSMQFVIRAWNDATSASPVLVRLELRHATLARFSILSEDQLTLGGIGTLELGGLIHTNNSRNANPAITISGSTTLATGTRVTTTTGGISGCPVTAQCRSNVRESIRFGSADQAMNQVSQLSARGRCVASSFAACEVGFVAGTAPAAGSMAVLWANLGGPGGCVTVGQLNVPIRTDTGTVRMLNDRVGPSGGPTNTRNLCPARGGGAILFGSDVILTGQRAAGTAAVTIMARRSAAGAAASGTTLPASIYLQQTSNGSGLGTLDPNEPVGVVAQGGVYFPSWAMTTVNDQIYVRNVAAMAVNGEIAYSPSIQAIAADGATPGGLGLQPDQARIMGYGYGTRLEMTGSLLSSGRMTFRYGQNASYIGYGQRDFTYLPSLAWNPPPYFPSDGSWHLADWTEFDA